MADFQRLYRTSKMLILGNSVQPAIRNNINTLNGQIVPVNTNNGFNNGQNAGVFQQGGFPGNSVNPPSTENINQENKINLEKI